MPFQPEVRYNWDGGESAFRPDVLRYTAKRVIINKLSLFGLIVLC